MEKRVIIKKLIEHLTEKIEGAEKNLEQTRELAREAPGSNVSHSDTSKFQLSNVALVLDSETLALKKILAYVRGLPVKHSSEISTQGSLVTLSDEKGDEQHLLFVEMGGGETVIVDGVPITTVTRIAPLARTCLGKKEQERFLCKGHTYTIKKIE